VDQHGVHSNPWCTIALPWPKHTPLLRKTSGWLLTATFETTTLWSRRMSSYLITATLHQSMKYKIKAIRIGIPTKESNSILNDSVRADNPESGDETVALQFFEFLARQPDIYSESGSFDYRVMYYYKDIGVFGKLVQYGGKFCKLHLE